jgi:hypothetical protein
VKLAVFSNRGPPIVVTLFTNRVPYRSVRYFPQKLDESILIESATSEEQHRLVALLEFSPLANQNTTV